MAANRFVCDYARLGTASCKKCKQKLEKGALRLGKLTPNPFSEGADDMKQWFHPACLFDSFVKTRANTKRIEDTDDVEEFNNLKPEDKSKIKELIKDMLEKRNQSPPKKATVQTKLKFSPSTTNKKPAENDEKSTFATSSSGSLKTMDPTKQEPIYLYDPTKETVNSSVMEKDMALRTFRKLCADVANESSYTGKCKIMKTFYEKGTSGSGFKGNVYLVVKLLLPMAEKRIYNLKDKQLMKLFSQLFLTDKDEMATDLEQGDAAETVRIFFEKSNSSLQPAKSSLLSLKDVDDFLERMSQLTREEEQQKELGKITKRCTSNDLKMIIRLMKHDLRINVGSKYVLEALDLNGYDAFQNSRNLYDVTYRIAENWRDSSNSPHQRKVISIQTNLLTPVRPMLAEACRSVEQALQKCPEGMYAEIKYDGERVQVHKKGDNFSYFSRSLKPVSPHKVQHLKEYIPKAFPNVHDLMIDAEVLMVDTTTSKPLPFGTLGVHKKSQFKDACVGLFVFDCMYINGENLMDKPLKKRRKILEKVMTSIEHHVMLSEKEFITTAEALRALMMKVFNEGLEGLVMKNINSVYEPGKRHWLKVKKDYLADGSMADSADLIVLGAYFGTGNKGGIMSVFLMGAYDSHRLKFCTVTKVGNGFDDKTLEQLQTELNMIKISKTKHSNSGSYELTDEDFSKIPSWLDVHRSLAPDFVIDDPKKAPVWEITGAEFSLSDKHTAGGISIRFPRVTKIRKDKTWREATDVARLKELYKISKENQDFQLTETTSTNNKKKANKRSASIVNSAAPPTPGPSSSKIPKVKDAKEDDEEEEEDIPRGSHSLKSLFLGMTFHPNEDVRKEASYPKLYQYLIAYDADVVENTAAKATHLLVTTKNDTASTNDSLTVVSTDWVWNCIKQGRRLPLSF